MDRNNQISRILSLLDLMGQSTRGLTVKEAWSRLGDRDFNATERTVYRDFQALEQAGIPLHPQGDESSLKTRWKLDSTAKISGYLVLTSRELFALFLARGALKPLSGSPFFADLDAAFEKLESKFGIKSRQYFDSLSEEMKFEPKPKWGLGVDSDVLDTVRSACAEGHLLTCEYASAYKGGEVSKRTLGPHYLYFAKGAVYLVAEDFKDNKVKLFAVPRMRSAQMLTDEYQGERSNPDKLFEASFGVYQGKEQVSVEIEFEATAAAYVRERQWHQSQELVILPKGKLLLKMQVALTPDLKQFVLGFGSSAQVKKPKSLMNEIRDEAKKLMGIYSKK